MVDSYLKYMSKTPQNLKDTQKLSIFKRDIYFRSEYGGGEYYIGIKKSGNSWQWHDLTPVSSFLKVCQSVHFQQ